MRLFAICFFLTLVGTSALAVPHGTPEHPVFDDGSASEQTPPVEEPDPEKTESVRMAIPDNPVQISPETSTISSLSVQWKPRAPTRLQIQGGILNGSLFERDLSESSPTVGLLYYWSPRPRQAWDASVDFATKGWLRLGGGKRFYVGQDRGHLPYLRLGLAQTSKLNGFPTGLLDLKPMKLSAGVGFANLFNGNESWNAQFDLQWGLIGPSLQFTLGWNFDFEPGRARPGHARPR